MLTSEGEGFSKYHKVSLYYELRQPCFHAAVTYHWINLPSVTISVFQKDLLQMRLCVNFS